MADGVEIPNLWDQISRCGYSTCNASSASSGSTYS
jgi:hypothetical protein